MSFLDGIGGDIMSAGIQVGLAMATGGSSLMVEGALGAIGSEVVGQLGQELGLNSTEISIAQTAFSAAFGSSAGLGTALQGLGGSATEQGQFASQISQLQQQMEQQILQQLQQQSSSDASGTGGSAGSDASGSTGAATGGSGVSGGGGILLAIAEALGHSMDQQLQNMASLGQQLSAASSSSGSSGGSNSQIGTLTAKMQVASQEMSMIGSALTNTLQSTGDALSALAKKG